MSRILSSFLLASVFAGPGFAAIAWAADFTPASKIDAITVFPQGADVARLAHVELPTGEHRIILSGLPQDIDPQSIRVEGEGTGTLSIASVDSKQEFKGDAKADERRNALEKDIEGLAHERANLDMTIADAAQQRNFLMNLADRQIKGEPQAGQTGGIDVNALSALLELVSQKTALLTKDTQAAQARQREIDKQLEELNAKLAELAPNQSYATEVTVNVNADTAFNGELRVSYRTAAASWLPYYDARLAVNSADKAPLLELVRRAEVTQSSGEDWTDVALTLSTARPQGATAAPELPEDILSPLPPLPPPMPVGAVAESAQMDAAASPEPESGAGEMKKQMAPRAKLVQQQASIEMAGFQANYVIATRVSISNGGQSKKVRISSDIVDAKLMAVAVPRIDPAAYLTASFDAVGEGPQLPGSVNLYRDGVYVGQGMLPLLNAGEEAKLGFGVDDQVKVVRSEVKRLGGEEGLFTSSNMEERAWDVSVTNLHDIAMPVTVTDRVPVASSKDITVTEIAGMTPPTVRDVEKRRGVLSWTFELAPKEEKTLKTGYKISWPEGVHLSLSE